jgi:hypothetical protein
MVMSGIVAFAEETPTTEKTPMVVYSIEIPLRAGENGEERIGVWEVMGYEQKQPLIFQDTAENPKTGFSCFTPEEIQLMPDGYMKLKVKGTSKTTEYNHRLKKALLEIEALYEYKTQKDGTIVRSIRTKKDTASLRKSIIMYEPSRDNKNSIDISVCLHEQQILYEVLAYGLYNEITPYVNITRVDGSTLSGLIAIFESISEDARNKPSDGLARDVAGWSTKKSKKQIESDMEYVKELLLNVTEGDFTQSLYKLMEIFSYFSYKFDDGEVAFIIKNVKMR